MIRSSSIVLAAVSLLATFSPGVIQSSVAAGSAFDQLKSTEANELYKALNTSGGYDVGAPAYPRDGQQSPSARQNPGSEGSGAAASAPMYEPLRGGREY